MCFKHTERGQKDTVTATYSDGRKIKQEQFIHTLVVGPGPKADGAKLITFCKNSDSCQRKNTLEKVKLHCTTTANLSKSQKYTIILK